MYSRGQGSPGHFGITLGPFIVKYVLSEEAYRFKAKGIGLSGTGVSKGLLRANWYGTSGYGSFLFKPMGIGL